MFTAGRLVSLSLFLSSFSLSLSLSLGCYLNVKDILPSFFPGRADFSSPHVYEKSELLDVQRRVCAFSCVCANVCERESVCVCVRAWTQATEGRERTQHA